MNEKKIVYEESVLIKTNFLSKFLLFDEQHYILVQYIFNVPTIIAQN